jgi:hypothetical protein
MAFLGGVVISLSAESPRLYRYGGQHTALQIAALESLSSARSESAWLVVEARGAQPADAGLLDDLGTMKAVRGALSAGNGDPIQSCTFATVRVLVYRCDRLLEVLLRISTWRNLVPKLNEVEKLALAAHAAIDELLHAQFSPRLNEEFRHVFAETVNPVAAVREFSAAKLAEYFAGREFRVEDPESGRLFAAELVATLNQLDKRLRCPECQEPAIPRYLTRGFTYEHSAAGKKTNHRQRKSLEQIILTEAPQDARRKATEAKAGRRKKKGSREA